MATKININPYDKGHILLVSLNRSYDSAKAEEGYKRPNMYEKTRKYWPISKSTAEKTRLVLGVYRGIVVAVLNVSDYTWTKVNNETGGVFTRERCCFEGELDNGSPYMNTDVSDYPFHGNSVRIL